MNRRKSISSHGDATFAKFTSTFINSSFNYKSIMSTEMYSILNDIAQAKSAPFGALFLSMVTTTNYIAASSKTKLQMAAQVD